MDGHAAISEISRRWRGGSRGQRTLSLLLPKFYCVQYDKDPNFLFLLSLIYDSVRKGTLKKARKDRDDIKYQIGHLYAGKLNGKEFGT
jgi:hypothetical protein